MSRLLKVSCSLLEVTILSVVLILEFSKMAKNCYSGGAMTFEALAPMLIGVLLVAVITNSTVIVQKPSLGLQVTPPLNKVASIVAHGGAMKYDTISGLKGQDLLLVG